MKKILLTLCGLCLALATLQAATFTVTKTADTNDGVCDGDCSLREAIAAAEANAGPDVIIFSNTITQPIIISSPFLVITSDLTIDGADAPNLTISGGGNSRIFWIQNGTITIQNLTLANGYAKGGNGGGGGMGAGGAIFMHEGKQDPMNPTGVLSGNIDLRLINVMLKNNRAIGGNSGNLGGGGGLGGSGRLVLNGGGGVLGDAGNFAGGSITSAEEITLVPGNNGGIAIFGNGGVNTSAGGFGGGGGGGRPGGNGGFGGGGGAWRPGGFGGGGGANDGAGGNGGFGGGGGNGSSITGIGGFGGGNGGSSSSDNGGGAGFGGAIFVASGKLSLQGVTFEGNSAVGGTGFEKGKGYGGALFIFNEADNGGNAAPGRTNDPQVFACNVTYTNNSAADDPNTTSNNDNFYGSVLDPANNIIYVNASASGANNGTTWTNAFTSLQDALSAACTCGSGEIWVAKGTYYPDEGMGKTDNDRNSTLQLCEGVKVYGGFTSGQMNLSDRDPNPATNGTILSGDLDKNDTPNFGNNSNNAYQVVSTAGVTLATVLDGFTITAGNANGGVINDVGGGMYNDSGSPNVSNCTFADNNADRNGGGMFNINNSSPTVVNCTFSSNRAKRNDGGGMFNTNNSSPTVTNCTFLNNNADRDGGGMCNTNNSSPTVTKSIFSGNHVNSNGGGGMSNTNNSSPTIANCTFSDNIAVQGGGIRNIDGSPTITNCTFSGNSVSNAGGGGMYNQGGSPKVANCIFLGNRVSNDKGGGMHNNGSTLTVTNCTFSGNTANVQGGGMYNNGSTLTVTNCTFSGNTANVQGGGMYNNGGSVTVTNTIIWNNRDNSGTGMTQASIFNDNSTPIITYSLIQNITTDDANGNIDGITNAGNSNYPLFVDADGTDNTTGTTDDNLRLLPASPAINEGNNAAVPADAEDVDNDGDVAEPTPDLDGEDRILQSTVDMGAYEQLGCPAFTMAPPEVMITDSKCTGNDCSPANGSISAPANACPPNATLQYSVDGGNSWSSTLPIYDNDGLAQTIQTRCSCTAYPNIVSDASEGVTTVPGTCMADYTITTAGNTIVVTDVSGNSDQFIVSENGTGIQFNTIQTRKYALNGGTPTCFPVTIPNLNTYTAITIHQAGGDDELTVNGFTNALPNLTLNGGIGNDRVVFAGDLNFRNDANLDLDLQNDDASPGTDAVTLNGDVNLKFSGSGAATIKVSKNVILIPSSSIETVNGNLVVEANQQATATTGDFRGIDMNAATLKISGSGVLTAKGKGGDTNNNQNGIHLVGDSQIIGGTTGTTTLVGTGGTSMGAFNHGVLLDKGELNTNGSALSVTGEGGGTGTSGLDWGVVVDHGSKISAGGSGKVTVNGTGGTGTSDAHYGVIVSASGSQITSSGGDVEVTGFGGNNAPFNNIGVFLNDGGIITAGINGKVTVMGTGGTTTGASSHGVLVRSTDSKITSSGGAVSVTGQGGKGDQGNNLGVFVQEGGEISAGGSAKVTVKGTGGAAAGDGNYGVLLRDGDGKITSAGGDVEVNGFGGGTGASSLNWGISIESNSQITAGGSGKVTVNGTSGETTGDANYGVRVGGTNAKIQSNGGDVSVTGTSKGKTTDKFNNNGVLVISTGVITAGGSGKVTIMGTGGPAAGVDNRGVVLSQAGSQITSSGGDVTVIGQGGGTGASIGNFGVNVKEGATISAGGSGKVIVTGTGGTGTGGANHGVFVQESGSQITSSGGAVSVTGIEGTNGSGLGMVLFVNGVITTATNGGTITLKANNMDIPSGTSVSANTSNSVTILSYTNGVAINLGTGGDPIGGPLNFPDDELDRITAGTINVGDANTGNIAVTNNITRASTTNFNLTTSSAIHFNMASLNTNGGNVEVNAANGVSPDASGVDVNMSTGTFSFETGTDLNIQLNGLTPDVDYDQLNVMGLVNLTGADLNLTGSQNVSFCNATFTIVNNDSNDAIIGTFNGLAQDATVANIFGAGLNGVISYKGGTGNDVVITVQDNVKPTAACKTATITLNANGTYTLQPSEIDNNSSDNCGITKYTLSKTNFTCADIGKQMVTLTVEDANGLKNECMAEVTILASAACEVTIVNTDGPTIKDPCTCSNISGLFDEEIIITSNAANENWELSINNGLLNPANNNQPFATNTPFQYLGLIDNKHTYSLVGRHQSGVGYNITATSSFYPNDPQTTSNKCDYPTVQAGNGITICQTKPVNLVGVGQVTNAAGIWSTSGDGQFVGGTKFGETTAYLPGVNDKKAGKVTLTLTADSDLAKCDFSDQLEVTILKTDCGKFPWNGN